MRPGDGAEHTPYGVNDLTVLDGEVTSGFLALPTFQLTSRHLLPKYVLSSSRSVLIYTRFTYGALRRLCGRAKSGSKLFSDSEGKRDRSELRTADTDVEGWFEAV